MRHSLLYMALFHHLAFQFHESTFKQHLPLSLAFFFLLVALELLQALQTPLLPCHLSEPQASQNSEVRAGGYHHLYFHSRFLNFN